MVKLFTDDEMIEHCAIYQPIPLALEQEILHYEGNPDYVDILNGVIKPTSYKIGQPVQSVSDYAYQLPFHVPVDPEKFLNEYNKIVEKNFKEKNVQVMNEILEKIDMRDEQIKMKQEDVNVYEKTEISDIESVADSEMTDLYDFTPPIPSKKIPVMEDERRRKESQLLDKATISQRMRRAKKEINEL